MRESQKSRLVPTNIVFRRIMKYVPKCMRIHVGTRTNGGYACVGGRERVKRRRAVVRYWARRGGGGCGVLWPKAQGWGDRFFRDGTAVHAAGVGLTLSADAWRAGGGTKRIDRRRHRRRRTARAVARLVARTHPQYCERKTHVASALPCWWRGGAWIAACVRSSAAANDRASR